MVDWDDKNLVAWYRLENNALDERATNNGTFNNLSGATYVLGGAKRYGGSSINFIGAGDTVVNSSLTGSILNCIGGSPFTIACWFKSTSWAASGAGKGVVTLQPAGLRGVGIQVSQTQVLAVERSNSVEKDLVLSSTIGNDGLWHHLAMSDNGAGTFYGYVDGVQVGTQTSEATLTPTQLNIGGFRPMAGNAEAFVGSIDDVRIYNRFMSEAEIKHIIYSRGSA